MDEWERKIQEELALRAKAIKDSEIKAEDAFFEEMRKCFPREVRILEDSQSRQLLEEIRKSVWKNGTITGLVLHEKGNKWGRGARTRYANMPPSFYPPGVGNVAHFYDGERSESGNSIVSTDVFRSLDFERKYHGRTFGIDSPEATLRYRLFSESTQHKIGHNGSYIGDGRYGYSVHQYSFLDVGVVISKPEPIMFMESTHASWDFIEPRLPSEPIVPAIRFGAESPWQGYMCFFQPGNPNIRNLLTLDLVKRRKMPKKSK